MSVSALVTNAISYSLTQIGYAINPAQRGHGHLVHKMRLTQMSFDDPKILWWLQASGYAAFAAFGGFMGHLLRTIDGGHPISWGRALLESASAGFVGMLVLLTCQAMGLSEQWTGVIVGVAGWLGASVTIRMLELVVRQKLGLGEKANSHEDNQSEG